MSSNSSVTKAEYLKRYMSDAKEDKPRKRRKKVAKALTVKVGKSRIVDDDIDIKSLLPNEHEAVEEEEEEDPTVAEFIDERPEHVKQLETYKNEKWKTIKVNNSTKKEVSYDSESDTPPEARHSRHDLGSDSSPDRALMLVRQDSAARHDSDSDNSSAKSEILTEAVKKRNGENSFQNESPSRRKIQRRDYDQLPPRRGRRYSNSDQSPPRRVRRDSNSDQSPPRRGQRDSSSDQSPPRRGQRDSNSDQSPPRKGRKDPNISQTAPSRKRKFSDSDQSPPRKSRIDSKFEQSSPRMGRRESDSDQSPPRRMRKNSDSGQTLPGRKLKNAPSQENAEKAKETLRGAKAGLSSAKEMKREAEKLRRKEEKAFKAMDDATLGKNAATVIRDKTGRKMDMHAEMIKDRAKTEKENEKLAKYSKWSKGLKQQETQAAALEDTLNEMAKPLARYKDDADLDANLRDQDREGDPMLAFMKKKTSKNGPKRKTLPRYSGPAPPPNRFGIEPGYRWDGVDRYNGYEKKFFETINARQATSQDAFKWSTEDL